MRNEMQAAKHVSQCNTSTEYSRVSSSYPKKTLKLNEPYSYICSSITKISTVNITFFLFF